MRTLCRTARASRGQIDGCPRKSSYRSLVTAFTGLPDRTRATGLETTKGMGRQRFSRRRGTTGTEHVGTQGFASEHSARVPELGSGDGIRLQGSVADGFSNIPREFPNYVRSPQVKPVWDARESVRFWKTPSRIRARRQSTVAKNPLPESPVNAPTGTPWGNPRVVAA
jgi:hypothetical protein